jgi:hypothetical protein
MNARMKARKNFKVFGDISIQLATVRATVTRLQVGQLRNWGSIPNKGKTLRVSNPVQHRNPFQCVPTQGLFLV